MFAYRAIVDDAMSWRFAWRVFIRSRGIYIAAALLLSTVACIVSAILAYRFLGDTWVIGIPVGFSVAPLALCLGYFIRLWATAILARGRPYVEYEFDDYGLTRRTSKVEEKLNWRQFRDVESRDEYLMLAVSRIFYLCLPTAGMPERGREYILERMRNRLSPPNNALERERGR
jgi:hypothetical protein